MFVRPVTPEKDRKMQQITRSSKQPVRVRWAIVVLASVQRHTCAGESSTPNPNTTFAVNSKIRLPDYVPKVA
ncbi:hypothetical protein D5S18_03725 [Nocardia panacis]|uniref:Uncharacterized protein n=1 Tax=Nocardia panacis TaxID=2340916 RepID=A0A3A4L7Q4_9NOCA|nr:hypothetical protein D5S18_03725 [Nocardia panacis]